ncbi:MAG: hypothetical protein RLZZ598_1285 [Pseudomonadota bacterium]|jgi:hypothetical protein
MLLFIGLDWCLRRDSRLEHVVLQQLPLLQAWLLERPHVYIVVSADWRRAYTLKVLRTTFGGPLHERVIGVTEREVLRRNQPGATVRTGESPRPFAEDLFMECCGYPPGERELEIWLWRNTSDMAHHTWRALDDRPDLFSPRCKELIEVDGNLSITAGTINALDEWLPPTGSRS